MLDTKNPLAPITVGSGFIVTVNPAVVLNNGAVVNIPSTIISLTPSATNFIHITSAGSLTVNTTGFPAGCLPIATVTCSSTSVTNVADSRPDFYIVTSSTPSPTTLFAPWGGIVSSAITTGSLSGANKIQVSGFYVPNSVQFSKIALHINTGDGSTADWGVYDSSGTLKASVGGHAVGAGGFDDRNTSQGSVTLAVGKYYFAFTANGVGVTLLSAA